MRRADSLSTAIWRMTHGTSSRIAVGLTVWLISAAYLGSRVNCGWIPHDECTIAQCAERVLGGELPHRDFDTPYTGGLEFLNAGAFELFGVKLSSLRWPLLAFSLAFVATVYAIALRAAPPLVAGLVTLLCVGWSLADYFEAMPSWYNLFFAAFGTLALIRHVETGRNRWLFVAGLCGACSFLVKSVGLYYLAAVLLFLCYREQNIAAESLRRERRAASAVLTTIALSLFAAMVLALVWYRPQPMELLHFAAPGVLLSGFLIYNTWRLHRQEKCLDLRRLRRSLGVLGTGVAIPIIAFLIPYIATNSVDDLFYGVFLLPQKRMTSVIGPLPSVLTLAAALPLAFVLGWPLVTRRRLWKPWLSAAIAAALALVVALSGHPAVYQAVWWSVRPVVPLTTVAACLTLSRSGKGWLIASEHRQMLFLLAAMAAMISLVQVPYAHPFYFLYVAPMVILAALFIVSNQRFALRGASLCFLGFYLVFAVAWLNGADPRLFAESCGRAERVAELASDRGGLRIPEDTAFFYNRVVKVIREHSPENGYIYAAPDCPEIYFLSGRKNPTRTFFDLFDEDYGRPEREQRILDLLEEHRVDVVALGAAGQFSGRTPASLLQKLALRYPHGVAYADERAPQSLMLVVLWRERLDGKNGKGTGKMHEHTAQLASGPR